MCRSPGSQVTRTSVLTLPVEAAFEGPPDAVDALVRFSETGPRGARVTDVEVFEEPPEGLEGFGIS